MTLELAGKLLALAGVPEHGQMLARAMLTGQELVTAPGDGCTWHVSLTRHGAGLELRAFLLRA